ncbi:MAG: PQQ-binding-like beta-propeller repeat protein, partial [Nitrososphaerales archaeon]
TISGSQYAMWPMFKGNAQHIGQSPFNGSEENTLKWNFPTGNRITSSPVVGADGTIYVGSYDSHLYAINPDGSMKWRFAANEIIDSTPAISSDGTIYFGSWDKNLYSIDPNGNGKWRMQTSGRIVSSATIGSDGTIYVGSDDTFLYAINHNGSLKWSFKTEQRIVSTPAIAPDGTVYVGSFDNNLYAINPNGTENWRFVTKGFVFSSPSIASDGTIYFGSYDGNVYSINADGSMKWKFFTGNVVQASPAIAHDGTIYVGSFDGFLYALNPDGALKWKFKTGDLIVSSALIDSDGTIYFGSVDKNLYAVNPDGTEKWRLETDARIFSSPAIGKDGTVYVGSVDNNLYAVGEPLASSTSALALIGLVNETVGRDEMELYVVEVDQISHDVNKQLDVEVILKNMDESPRNFDPSLFKLKDIDGKEYIADQSRSTLKNVRIQAGDIIRGELSFDLPDGVVTDLFFYHDLRGLRLIVNLTDIKLPPDDEPTGLFETGSNVGKKLINERMELTILDEKFFESDPQHYVVNISIKNIGSQTLKYDQTFAYVKDSIGSVYTPYTSNRTQKPLGSGELESGGIATGEISFIIPSTVDSVIFVYDDIQSNSYFVVPEFPFVGIVTIAAAISLMSLVSRFRRPPRT